MVIGGYRAPARRTGIIYVRAEYPLAVHHLRTRHRPGPRLRHPRHEHPRARPFHFDIELVEGAGAFVCGEETALIASLEGFAGRSASAPAVPAQKGPVRLPHQHQQRRDLVQHRAHRRSKGRRGSPKPAAAKSAGTKVFSLVGKVKNTGLVEMPLGTPLAKFVYEIGGGGVRDRAIKAVQTGGPSGGCIPHEMFDTPVDYETLAQIGSIMGSGGMVVMDEDNCMVDIARYFIEFTHSESCGKCVPCRVGSRPGADASSTA